MSVSFRQAYVKPPGDCLHAYEGEFHPMNRTTRRIALGFAALLLTPLAATAAESWWREYSPIAALRSKNAHWSLGEKNTKTRG